MITRLLPLTGYISGTGNEPPRALLGNTNRNIEMRSLSTAAYWRWCGFPQYMANTGRFFHTSAGFHGNSLCFVSTVTIHERHSLWNRLIFFIRYFKLTSNKKSKTLNTVILWISWIPLARDSNVESVYIIMSSWYVFAHGTFWHLAIWGYPDYWINVKRTPFVPNTMSRMKKSRTPRRSRA